MCRGYRQVTNEYNGLDLRKYGMAGSVTNAAHTYLPKGAAATQFSPTFFAWGEAPSIARLSDLFFKKLEDHIL